MSGIGNSSSLYIRTDFPDRLLEAITAAALERPTYLDKYYALQAGRTNGAKRLVVVLPGYLRDDLDPDWLDAIGGEASVVWRGLPVDADKLEEFEYVWQT